MPGTGPCTTRSWAPPVYGPGPLILPPCHLVRKAAPTLDAAVHLLPLLQYHHQQPAAASRCFAAPSGPAAASPRRGPRTRSTTHRRPPPPSSPAGRTHTITARPTYDASTTSGVRDHRAGWDGQRHLVLCEVPQRPHLAANGQVVHTPTRRSRHLCRTLSGPGSTRAWTPGQTPRRCAPRGASRVFADSRCRHHSHWRVQLRLPSKGDVIVDSYCHHCSTVYRAFRLDGGVFVESRCPCRRCWMVYPRLPSEGSSSAATLRSASLPLSSGRQTSTRRSTRAFHMLCRSLSYRRGIPALTFPLPNLAHQS